jgi:Uncharacterized protein conserved in bacteria
MISDFVKGKTKFNYSINIQKGIALHRDIDIFTDEHTATKKAKQLLKPLVGLYSGAFVDVVYDHFLSIDKNEFENENILMIFTQTTYSLLQPYENIFPEKFKIMFPFMQQQNWLYNYQFLQGIEGSFGGVARRAKYLNDSSRVFKIFENYYADFKNYYAEFFPSVKQFAQNKFYEILAQ